MTDGYPEGTPCSPLAAQVVSLIDGMTSVGDILNRICDGQDASRHPSIAAAVFQTMRILHVDGSMTGLLGPVE